MEKASVAPIPESRSVSNQWQKLYTPTTCFHHD